MAMCVEPEGVKALEAGVVLMGQKVVVKIPK
jgi:hypothetical protein